MTATLDDEVADLRRANADLQRRLDAALAERDEGLEQQTAAAEVLEVINSSPGDLAPVFDAILEKAHTLCGVEQGVLVTYEGEYFRAVADHNMPQPLVELLRRPFRASPGSIQDRLVRGERLIHIPDQAALGPLGTGTPIGRASLEAGIRTVLLVPLRKDGNLIGYITATRTEARPFDDKQIALLENFAAQAVVAMEIARLITETREALEQQTATAEVLGVINSSPGDLAPVFDAIVEKAMKLCDAAYGALRTFDGELFHLVAMHGPDTDAAETVRQRGPARPTGPFAQLARGERIVHVMDAREMDEYRNDPATRERVDLRGIRTWLAIALHKDAAVLGAIMVYRQEVRPFSDKQIALVQNFAAQAVIAMENARLISETREALDQQTATAEVLQVINASPGDLQPVFDAMLEKTTALCDAAFGVLWSVEGGRVHAAASHGVPGAYRLFLASQTSSPGPDSAVARTLRERILLHFDDASSGDAYRRGDPFAVAAVELGGVRTLVNAPLIKDDAVLGILAIYRKEVRPFTDKQIALLQNFAAQAVIAMENARLITETKEALDQQTATAEVLQVINSSPGDLAPVFDAILLKANNLCGVAYGSLELYDGENFRAVAVNGLSDTFADMLRQGYPASQNPATRPLIGGERFSHISDLAETDFSITQSSVELVGVRTLLCIPLRRDNALLGMIASARREVHPFSEKEITLLENFAAQAVIAMENARLLTETREALDQQTATAEVLQVINASPGDLGPVFDAMVERAARLCEADEAALRTFDGELLYLAAVHGSDPDVIARLRQLGPTRPFGLYEPFARGERVAHIVDVRETDIFRDDPVVRERLEIRGIRTWLAVALHKEGVLLGVINVHRHTVSPFSNKQIALLENFAAQAVIAIENARLIAETREALDQQTATAEVLGVINSSPGNLAPVFDAILEKAHSLCNGAQGSLELYDGEYFRAVATHDVPEPFAGRLRHGIRGSENFAAQPLLAGEPFVHIKDVAKLDHPIAREAAAFGTRTLLSVPLRKGDSLFGMIVATRVDGPFSDKQIGLLQSFAAQAVIAMENARLITETREALEQQTATAEVLGIINSSPGDLTPAFEAMLEKAVRLCEATFGILWGYDGDCFHAAALHGVPIPFAEYLREPLRPGPGTSLARMIAGEPLIHVVDVTMDEAYRTGDPGRRALADLGGARTALTCALRKDNKLLGVFTVYRNTVRSFSAKQIALLQTFADQAVIAMENARLLTETREALDQQTATAEVLGVINSSPGDLAPVFDAMLEKAMRLCEASCGFLSTYDGEQFNAAATRGVPTDLPLAPVTPGPGGSFRLLVNGENVVPVADIRDSEGYRTGRRSRRAFADRLGARTAVWVALRKDKTLLGAFILYRQEVRPFSGKEIALLQNFAAQAVVAMENARLLDEIRQRQAELRVTFDNMADGVVMFDEDFRLAAWNRNFQELLDLPDAVLAERPSYADYLRLLAERGEFGGEDIEAELSRRLEGTDQELRLERTRPDGRVIEVRRNSVPNGGFVLIYSDITERKRSEAEIRAARDAAEAAYRDLKAAQANLIQAEKMASLGQLTAGIAHEIKNPLNFVNNFAGLSVELLEELKEATEPAVAMLDESKRAEVDETIEMLTGNLEKIAEHGKRADNIVKSMLEHSRGVTGERREVDLNQLVEEALNLAYHGARAQDQTFNITLERDYAESLKPIEVAPQEMTRVFLNLFGNGFYAANKRLRENGDGSFRPSLTVATRDLGDAVEVRVRDNGTGIPPEIKDKLFQPFFTTKPTGEGTGLGLSISYDIVTQQHGGTITVDSRVGEFTEFTIRLPRAHRASAEAAL